MKQIIWRQKRVGCYRSTCPHCRGESAVCRGIARNSISELVRGPTESNAVGEPELLNSYTTSASKSKKRVTRLFRTNN